MNSKLNVLCLGATLALTGFMTNPVMADEWNKRTEFQFSGPVQIPGKVLAAGKYVFELLDSDSNRNIVEVFSEDSNGKDTLVATLMAIPDYMEETPDKPIVHFEERHSGSPEAIHSWFYPGENTGWQFIYAKDETSEASMNTTPSTPPANPMPAPTPVATAAAPSVPPVPQAQEAAPVPEEATVVEQDASVDQDDTATPVPAEEVEIDVTATADPVLPETAGDSGLEAIAGIMMLGVGIAAVSASRLKSLA